jgi:uncharacterized membrane protein
LWQAAVRDLSAKTPFRRLLPSVPLFLEALALLALALALMGLVTRSNRLQGPRTVLVIDVSASMATSEGTTTRLALALQAARGVLSRLTPGTELMILGAGREPELISPFERDRARLEAALARTAVREVEGQLGRSVAMAADQLRQRGGGRVVVVTDGAVADADNLVAPGLPLELIQVGSAQDNTAIVRTEVTRTVDPVSGRDRVEVFALVSHQGKKRRDLFITLSLRNVSEPLASRKISLAPGERAPLVLSFDAAPGDVGKGLELELSPHDALASDDHATARVPAGQKLPVVVAPKNASPWLVRALSADADVELFRTELSGLVPESVPGDALLVIDGACPERLPGADLLIVNPKEGPCRSVTVGAKTERPLITSWAEADPRLRFLSFEGVQVADAHSLTVDAARDALVHTRNGVLIADISSPGRMGTLVGFDVGESNWPLRASFVLFVRNVVELARVHRIGGPSAPAHTGEPMTVRVPLDVETVELEQAGGRRETIRARDGLAVLPAATRVGFSYVTWKGSRPGSTLIPTSLVSEAESRISARPLGLGNDKARANTAPDSATPLDWVFGAAALLFIAADVYWITRRRAPRERLLKRPLVLALGVLAVTPTLAVLASWARLFDLPYVRFDRPLLVLPATAVTLWVLFRLLELSPRLSPPRRRLIELLAGSAALCAALCVVGLEVGRPLDRLTVVLAVDRSRSIDLVPSAANRVASELRLAELGMRDDDRIAVVAFGASAQVEDPARPKSRLPSAQRADVPRDGTDLGAAIRQSLAEIPPDSAARVVLLTDGVATRGDTTEAALAATALGVPIDAVPLDQGAIPDVRVVSVRVPSRAAEGEALDLRIVTQATQETEVQARIYRDGELVREGPTRVGQGEDVITLREVAPGPGLHRYDVELSAPNTAVDRSADDNAGSAFVRVRGPSTALVLESDPALARATVKALESAAFRVDAAGPSGLPADLAAFGRYDLVVLGDISATDFSASQLEAIRTYVRDLGGGLLLMGGDRALGPGGYARTPVEEVSPVSFDLKQERRRASLAEVIAVDYSGSMAMSVGSKTKLELANEAAARSAELLGAGDRLGVMHVDTVVSWTVPLAPVSDKADIAARIRKVGPGGGGIFVDLTLAAAYQALRRENVQLKHLLLFSDGNDAEERGTAPSLVTQAKRSGITTSVVALGNGSDVPALARMAELGGGRFYLIEDATRLPAVFAQETILASRSAINELAFVPRPTAPSAVLRGVDFGAAPPLQGYVVTIPKARSQVLLTGPEGDPILATWSAGVGRAGAFTSDYKDRWGRAWTDWDGAAKLFAQLGRDLARRVDDPRVRWEAEATGGELSLRATVFDDRGRHEAHRRLRARVGGPDGFSRDVPLEAVGAGSYATKIPLSRPGSYLATLVDDEGEHALATTGAALSAGEELRPTGTDRGELRRIASLSGGKLRDTLAGVFRDREARRFAYAPIGPWLAALAAAALLLSVASRRLAVPDFVSSRATRGKKARSEPEAPSAQRETENATSAGATLNALRARKGNRAEAGPAPSPAPIDPVVIRAPEAPPLRTDATTPSESAGSDGSEREVPPIEERKKSAAEILLDRRRARTQR